MSAPRNNQNATKDEQGIQISFYLSGVDVAYVKRLLARQLDREPTLLEIRKFARDKAKMGIWSAIKGEFPATII